MVERGRRVAIPNSADVDEIVSDYHKRGLLFLADPAKRERFVGSVALA